MKKEEERITFSCKDCGAETTSSLCRDCFFYWHKKMSFECPQEYDMFISAVRRQEVDYYRSILKVLSSLDSNEAIEEIKEFAVAALESGERREFWRRHE